ncbi:GDP-mannose transporter GONST1 isoform X5 [Hevea brasiliensis]|uniref:GDP-mannose transporter GONST1 isoform X5 n=1 Tax=Hevea brasiliensis TaxID=3981 RepID=UPI0025D16146|nr:GDP-mannose transporter GONST1 isoform X5 [Hevea brasiliensis]
MESYPNQIKLSLADIWSIFENIIEDTRLAKVRKEASHFRVKLMIFAMKSHENEEIDLEGGKLDKERDKTARSNRVIKIQNQALLSGLAYCISSCSMILVNKFVLSSYDFNAGISLMLYQNLISVIIVSVLSFLGIISTEPLTWRLIKIISAISGGITDMSFHAVGYAWQFINCFLTASYSLTLRRVMDTAKQVTRSGNLNEFSMVLLNNTLSLPLGIILIYVFNEVEYLSKTPLLRLPVFWLVMTLSGFLGLAISFTSMWFLHQTGATTYSLVGSLNKIPLSIASILLFKVPTNLENSASIFFGLLAGVFFEKAKMQERS